MKVPKRLDVFIRITDTMSKDIETPTKELEPHSINVASCNRPSLGYNYKVY